MATVSGPVVDLNSLWNLWTPFFQEQTEDKKQFREWQVAYGALEDVINSTPVDSDTYKEYYKYKEDLAQYGADILKGSHPAGVMADRAISIFRNYGRITGKVNSLQEKLKTSQTNRFNAVSQHPGGVIWQQNDVTDNIDDIANGKSINDKFIDRKGALDIVQNQFANIGASLARDPIYNKIQETEGFSVEVLQRGGVDALLIDDIWQTGTSKRASAEVVGMINHYINLVKQALGYDQFDATGKEQLKSLIKTGAVGALAATKVNVIDSGESGREELKFKYNQLGESKREFDANFNRSQGRGGHGRSRRHSSRGSTQAQSTPAQIASTYTAGQGRSTEVPRGTRQPQQGSDSQNLPPKRGSVSRRNAAQNNSERLK